jgi:hypothetical protein
MRYGWTCDRADWEAAKAAACDLTWHSTPFVAQYKSLVTTGPGIYMLILNTSNVIADQSPWAEIRAPLYIGQTMNLRRRFLEHVENRSTVSRYLEQLPLIQFCFASADPTRICDIEAALINVFGPRINRVQPAIIKATLLDPIKI